MKINSYIIGKREKVEDQNCSEFFKEIPLTNFIETLKHVNESTKIILIKQSPHNCMP